MTGTEVCINPILMSEVKVQIQCNEALRRPVKLKFKFMYTDVDEYVKQSMNF